VELLHALFGEVLVPPAVAAELEQPRSRFSPIFLQGLVFVRIVAPRDHAVVENLLLTIGPGEAEALALTVEVHANAVLIDEAAGRALARQRGLLPLGVLGILLRSNRTLLDLWGRCWIGCRMN
jgi:uncharacterized protein